MWNNTKIFCKFNLKRYTSICFTELGTLKVLLLPPEFQRDKWENLAEYSFYIWLKVSIFGGLFIHLWHMISIFFTKLTSNSLSCLTYWILKKQLCTIIPGLKSNLLKKIVYTYFAPFNKWQKMYCSFENNSHQNHHHNSQEVFCNRTNTAHKPGKM